MKTAVFLLIGIASACASDVRVYQQQQIDMLNNQLSELEEKQAALEEDLMSLYGVIGAPGDGLKHSQRDEDGDTAL